MVNWLDYERRLKSEDRSVRQQAIKELITYGITNVDQRTLEKYTRKKTNLLHLFVEQAHLRDALAPASSLAIASVLQSCWQDVEHILKNPSIMLNELGSRADFIRHDPNLLTWFYKQFENIYYYLYILTWDVRCAKCGKRIMYSDPAYMIVEDGKHNIRFEHLKCAMEELNTIPQYREMTAKIAEQRVHRVQ